MVSKKSPGRVQSRGGGPGEGVGWNTDNPEVRVPVAGEQGSEDLLDVVDGVVGVAPGLYQKAPEARNVSRGGLSDVIEE